jgi:hypothetical protein
MSLYIFIKKLLIKPFLKWRGKLMLYNKAQRARYEIKMTLKKYQFPELTKVEKREAKSYFKSKGYKLSNTLWHQYHKGMTGEFSKDFIPGDIFRSKITHKLNQMRQWPALMDKNLYYFIFHGYKQPRLVLSNINGFYYVNGEIVDEAAASNTLLNYKSKLIIKPSIWTGQGKNVKTFYAKDFLGISSKSITNDLLKLYKKDFLIQECVNQSEVMKSLNASSLNTFRIMSYLKDDEIFILSSIVRIGRKGSDTDNFSGGGIICGIDKEGQFNSRGLSKDGEKIYKTESGVVLEKIKIKNFKSVISFIKKLHERVPYFQIISWDIALDNDDKPVFVEYNTYTQDSKILQLANGTLFGDFTEEILAIGSHAN